MSHTRTQREPIHSTLAGDPVLADLVADFVAEMPGRIARLKRHYQAQDWETLRRTAHQLKGAAGSYGFDALTPLAHRLETLLAEGAKAKLVSQAMQELVAHCQRVTADVPR